MDAEYRCMLPSFREFRTKDDDIVTKSLEEQVNHVIKVVTIVCHTV